MKTLKRIKLVNWHLFSNETIEINGNTLITGENGSGKSTILDAMQYILTAGTTKFNMAANESSTRSLVTYVRGKLGIEGKEFLRSSDVVCHIALEFYNPSLQLTQVLGSVIEVGAQNKANSYFYQANSAFEDAWFLDKNKVLNYRSFKNKLQELKIALEIPKSSAERQTLFMNTMGIETKYRELIPRALAFRPVNNIQDFMYRYLLNEINIDIDALRESIRDYRKFEKQLEHEQKSFDKLNTIRKLYQDYENQQNELLVNDILIELLRMEALKDNLQKKQKQLDETSNRLIRIREERNEQSRQLLENMNLHAAMRADMAFAQLSEFKEKRDDAKSALDENNQLIKQSSKQYDSLFKSLDYLDIKVSKVKFGDKYQISENLGIVRLQVEAKRKELFLEIDEVERELADLTANRKRLSGYIERLRNQKQIYPDYVETLVNLLRDRLSEYYNEDVSVRPLFEYLDINDESWRNAIEGYLNTQRFNIIVDSKYFDMAVKVYDEYKNRLKIYRARIVDVQKTRQHTMKANSLAQYIETRDDNVRGYINYLLGSVICVNSVELLNKYPIAITKDTMVYKGYTVFALSPKIYQHPFIGRRALAVQLEDYESQYRDVMNNRSQKDLLLASLREKDLLIGKLRITDLEVQVAKIQNQQHLLDTFENFQKTVKQLESNPDLIEQAERLTELELRIKTLQHETSQSDQKIGEFKKQQEVLSNTIKQDTFNLEQYTEKFIVSEEENPEIMLDAQEKMVELLESQQNNYQDMISILQTTNKTLKNSYELQKTEITKEMIKYNQSSNSDYGINIESIDQYLNRYHHLDTVDLIEAHNNCRNAREKSEDQFHTSFIHQLGQNIRQAQKNINELNKQLKQHNFRDEHYRFDIAPSEDKNFAKYYNIITSEHSDVINSSTFMQMLNQEDREMMDQLFRRISMFDDESRNEKELRSYTDYRNYMSYDIITIKSNGDITRLSTVIKEKSGGETQTPFYVTIAASFEQLISRISIVDSGCVVLFDEAFNNMDSQRIRAMLEFYQNLNIQIIIAVPPERIASISEHVDTILVTGRHQNNGFTQRIQHGQNNA